MIQSISIENFRCFHFANIRGFSRINLIGGKNNAGKTALLEALLLVHVPANPIIRLLQQLRGEDQKTSAKLPEKAWENLFYNQNIQDTIRITVANEIEYQVELTCDENIDDFVKFFDVKKDEQDNDAKSFRNDIVQHNRKKSVLHLQAYRNKEKFTSTTFVATTVGTGGNGEGTPDIDKVDFIPSKYTIHNEELASDFDAALEKGNYQYIIKALQLVDSSITEARTSSIGEPVIKITRQSNKPVSLSSFGDAIYKVVSIILKALNAPKGGVLLIDEIENGLHYTVQDEFWRLLFILANEFELQIFATSHSLEMINAFNKVAHKTEFEKEAMYFELFRNPNTQEITANPFDMGMLHYDIIKNNPIRG
jgi:AAA15 family ATPase/GTPase